MTQSWWFDPLLSVLRDQPGERATVTFTIAEIAVLAGQRLPSSAMTRSYWWNRQRGSMGLRLATIGWRVVTARKSSGDFLLTFMREVPDSTA